MTKSLKRGMPALTISSVRTLFITRSLPYPPMGGGPLRNWQNISIMMQFGQVAVFSVLLEPNHSAEPPPGIAMWSVRDLSDRTIPLGEKIKLHLQQLWWLRNRIETYAEVYYAYGAAQELERVLAKFQPEIVIFEELWLYYYLLTVKRYRCRMIYDAHNAEAFLYSQVFKTKDVKGLTSKLKMRIKHSRIAAIERNFIRQVDQVWVCSTQDANILQTLCRHKLNVHVVPNSVDIAYYNSVRLGNQSLPPQLEPSPLTLIFTAAFNYQPNALAAQLLLEQIYPRLQAVYPNCRLLLVGISPTHQMQAAAKKNPQILVTGKVADMRPYLSAASAVIVPLLHGGGTRLKILEAFAAGRPVVSTSKGAEGLKVRDGEHLLIGDSPEALVAGICRLWSDADLGQKLAESAYKLVKTEYSWDVIGQQVTQACKELL